MGEDRERVEGGRLLPSAGAGGGSEDGCVLAVQCASGPKLAGGVPERL